MMFCSHDWQPRSGMDSGSICVRCWDTTERECVTSSGLSSGELVDRRTIDQNVSRTHFSFFNISFYYD